MKLKDIINQYCDSHSMSRREFGRKCGLSNAYISILVSGVNPRTGDPLSPTLETYNKIARAMGISLNALLDMLGDEALVTLNADFDTEDPDRQKLLDFVEQLPSDQLDLYITLFSLPTERLRAIVNLLQ